MRLLLSAYACDPNGVSEAANGWGWAVHLLERKISVHVLTAERHREAVEKELNKRPRNHLTFSFIEPRWPGVPNTISGRHYLAWQFAAVKAARSLHRLTPFDLAHHVTYCSLHVPSQLWRLRIPVVFGPVGGGQTPPKGMLSYFGKAQKPERLRTLMTKLLPFSPLHRMWMAKLTCIFTVNQETQLLVERMGRTDAMPAFEVGLPTSFYADSPRQFEASPVLKLLWAGRLIPRKALPLALDALQQTAENITLTIAGAGISPEEVYALIANRQLQTRVNWLGHLSVEQMREQYLSHDAFLFTSLRDTSGIQLLEAMALGLPVIHLDHQGATLLVPQDAGLKVSVTTQKGTATALAAAITRFATLSPKDRNDMSEQALERARTLSWTAHAERAHLTYLNLIRNPSSSYVTADDPLSV